MIVRVSSLSGLAADQLRKAGDHFRGLSPDLLTIDYQVDDRGCLVRTAAVGQVVWDSQTIAGESACRSCAVQRDLVWYLGREVASAADLLVVLPPGVSGTATLDTTETVKGAGDGLVDYRIGSIMTVIEPATLAETLRSTETLSEKGFCVGYGDETCGRLLIEDLQLSDSYILACGEADADESQIELGIELALHIAPQSRATMLPPAMCSGSSRPLPEPSLVYGFDVGEVAWRTSPGAIVMPTDPGRRVRSHLVSIRRPLHPLRLHKALTTAVAGSSWARGRIWMASAPDRKIAFTGLGRCVDYTDAGPWLADRPGAPGSTADAEGIVNWHPEYGDRGTWLAFTGDALEPDLIDECLSGCELTDEEIGRDPRYRQLFAGPLRPAR
ncbi:GTP-binding protein [Kribbella speibonae]|uniref:GTP-binding protein n=1 Tax=Kribbella speibonae TaxID=1572660 RepID=A0ABY2A2X8_9ACTN|nr:GTP-binding protein [Kribbella speibonae]TCC22754.1 GTP-binding protein [Kribbella speibonae]